MKADLKLFKTRLFRFSNVIHTPYQLVALMHRFAVCQSLNIKKTKKKAKQKNVRTVAQ